MFQQLYGDVYCWTERHGKPETTYDWYSYAVRIPSANALVLVDPLPLTDEEAQAIERMGTPTHILLTCNWHLRESENFRQRWGCQIYANEIGINKAEARMDGAVKHGDRLWDTIEVIHVRNVAWPEETAFLIGGEKGMLIVGDALCGGRADVGVPDGEIGVYDMKYIPNIHETQRSLGRLLEYPFDAICFAHGTPILHGAKEALQRFINTGFGPNK